MSHTHLLYQLQSLDSKVDQTGQELAQIKAQLGESDVLKKARREAETAQQNLRHLQTKLTDLELEVRGLSDKIANQEKILYSGKLLSAKEAANLQDEISSLKRWHGAREELLLETMVAAEEAEERQAQAQTALSTVEESWRQDQEKLIARQAILEAELADLRQQRPSLVEVIEAGDLKDYEDLRRKKGGVAVAGVKEGVCQACGMIASSNKIRQARAGVDLLYCSGCGRILYVL